MKYRNTETGVVVDVQSKIKTGVWVPVDPAPVVSVSDQKKPAPARKKREVKK